MACLPLQRESTIFPKQKGCCLQIYSTALSHRWLRAYTQPETQSIFFHGLKLNHFAKCAQIYSEWFFVVVVLLHILEKQSQASGKMACVCLVVSVVFFFPSPSLERAFYVTFPVLTCMSFNQSRKIFTPVL